MALIIPDTFATIAKMNIVHLLIILAENYGLPLQQFDVKNAFLHGDLEEEIYEFLSSSICL